MLYVMNWEMKEEKDMTENQFMTFRRRLSRTPRCGLPELHGGRTFRQKQISTNITRYT